MCIVCYGPTNAECDACGRNAEFSYVTGEQKCVCIANWAGVACNEYVGECNDNCDKSEGCSGPDPQNCDACAENAYRDTNTGGCVCFSDYYGYECSQY